MTWTWAEGAALGGRVGAMFTRKLMKFFVVSFFGTHSVERISLGSLRQSLRITVATLTDPHVILLGYGVPISQYVSMYSLIYYE